MAKHDARTILPLSVAEPTLLHGDAIEMLRLLPDECVDVVITDPPAGIVFMGRQWDSFAGYKPRTARGLEVDRDLGERDLLARAAETLGGLGLSSRLDGLVSADEGKPTGQCCTDLADELRAASKAAPIMPAWARGFVVFLVDLWTEVDRVLKPGGFICAWALPKTSDLAGMAMRAVGWDVWDSVLHLFGSGMNKSGDIGKKIDRARPTDPRTRVVCRWLRDEMTARGVTSKDIADAFGFHSRMADHWAARDTDSQPATPRLDQVPALLDVLGIDDPPPRIADALLALNDAKGTPGEAWWRREVTSVRQDAASINKTRTVPIIGGGTITESLPATEAAKRWTGWHSQMAPGHENWLIARKPKTRGMTDAQQLETHGCGAFNIGATRIPRGEADREAMRVPGPARAVFSGTGRSGDTFDPNPAGSHPRNVVLTRGGEGCPVEGLDRQSGIRRSAGNHPTTYSNGRGYESDIGKVQGPLYEDTGGASRFFTQFDQVVWYGGKVKTRKVPGRSDITNDHNTPKSLALMRHLVRLMAATAEHTGGLPAIVLDPTQGSGTTGVAAAAEGVRYIGIERDPVTVRSIATYASTSNTTPAPERRGCSGTGKVRAQARRPRKRKGLEPAPARRSCSVTIPDEPMSAYIARARILAAIGSPESAAEGNAAAPTGSQLGMF